MSKPLSAEKAKILARKKRGKKMFDSIYKYGWGISLVKDVPSGAIIGTQEFINTVMTKLNEK